MTDDDDTFVGMYDFIEALEAVIKAADPDKRAVLAGAIDGYGDNCPDEFFWAFGGQAPTLLSNVMMAIDWSCRPESQSRPRPAVRLVDRKSSPNE